jgi:two-component system OmpR family response regulator
MKILIVDDDSNIRLIASMSLDGDDVTIVEAESGAEALTVAAAEMPDVILLDMMMPDMDGKTTLTELKKNPKLSKIPVIFLTAKVQSSELESYVHLGATGVITKPFDPMTLPDEINQLLQKAST